MNPRDSYADAVSHLRNGAVARAIPLLELAVTDVSLEYAGSLLRYAYALARGSDVVDVTFDGKTFKFDLREGNLGLDMHHVDGKFFEESELRYCAKIVPIGSVIVDVGANTGNHAIFFAGMMSPSLVVPVEPVAAAVAALRRNLTLNGLEVDERGLGLAAGARAGMIDIVVPSGADLVVARVSEPGAAVSDVVRSVRLDDLVRERVDLLKIDVEGFETSVIAGAERILSQDKPILILEVNHDSQHSIATAVERFGYRAFKAFDGFRYQNVFFHVR